MCGGRRVISHFHSAWHQSDACTCPESEALERIFDLLSDLELDDATARLKALEHFDALAAGVAMLALIRRQRVPETQPSEG
jgi:hypothetical protein